MGRQSEYSINESRDFGTCQKCGETLNVIDSRKTATYTRRRKECPGCGDRFSTIETRTDEHDALVEKATLVDRLGTIAHEILERLGPVVAPTTDARETDMALLYTVQKLSANQIGKRYGITGTTVRRILKRNGVQMRAGHERP
jgi:ssDNA-binding Zn-finger/Zn-ribbon topoisomerase 1